MERVKFTLYGGTEVMVPAAALGAFTRKRAALLRALELKKVGNTNGEEMRAAMSAIIRANRQIDRNGWHWTPVAYEAKLAAQ